MNNIESDYIKTFAYILITLGIIILGCYIYTMYISEYTILERLNNKDVEITGQFGDFFGGVIGSLWTLAGVFLYFSAWKVQQKQLKVQKEEVDLDKIEFIKLLLPTLLLPTNKNSAFLSVGY